MTGGAAPEENPPTESGPVLPTGHDRVDAVLARARELETAGIAEHPGVFEELHAALAAELEAQPGGVPPGPVPQQGAGPR